ncbi:hemin uptake protein HemP [Dyella telluris]|uniref:Hemin uptake protein HemP n=1 Tax=Dyella telluris TaxID=2763498 RepID=A0A7G8Q777_9GAMM|nr:hemin uptake protein HemP [Dyella telluris]QNK02635.1 hemin uptake protein HemP [Dyella telluris]
MSSTVLSLPPGADVLARPFRLLSLKPKTRVAPDTAVRRVSSQVLLQGERELVIQHEGSEYHLRLTRNDKLILTK